LPAGFDRLIALRPQEIQVGILKRLRGTPIGRHDAEWQMVYNPHPPYEILRNKLIDFATMQKLRRFARYWDLVGNSGKFIENHTDDLSKFGIPAFRRKMAKPRRHDPARPAEAGLRTVSPFGRVHALERVALILEAPSSPSRPVRGRSMRVEIAVRSSLRRELDISRR